MLRAETKWLSDAIEKLPQRDLFPMLNVGSSTQHFRTIIQPWIEKDLFLPIRLRGDIVYHTDIKNADGVDLVGDLLDDKFMAELSLLDIRSVLCCSLLEHITPNDRDKVCLNLLSIIKNGGYLFITVPHKYMWHPDPIDTMYRPNIEELTQMFPHSETCMAEILLCERYYHRFIKRPFLLLRLLLRILTPFYNPRGWLETVSNLTYFFSRFEMTCIAIKKS